MAEARGPCRCNEEDSVLEPSHDSHCQQNANQLKFSKARPSRHETPVSFSAPMQYPNANHGQLDEKEQFIHYPGKNSENEHSTIREMPATLSNDHQSRQPLSGITDSMRSLGIQKSESPKFRPGTKKTIPSCKQNTGHNIIINHCQNLQIGDNNTMIVSNHKCTLSDSSDCEESDSSSDSEYSD